MLVAQGTNKLIVDVADHELWKQNFGDSRAEAGSAGMPTSAATEITRAFHYAFVVDDCDAAAEQLHQQGVQIVEGPRTRPDGARQLYLRDPDQHLVELFSVPQQQESGHES
jgi:catechol 2,3-dioxygenase-like lactoylglutathione lyase family enzyme